MKRLWIGAGVVVAVVAFARGAKAAAPARPDDDDDDRPDPDGSSSGNWSSPLAPYTERRVKLADYGTLTASDARLEPVPGQAGRKLHWLAVDGWLSLEKGLTAAGFKNVRLGSAWRKPAFGSLDEYEKAMIAKYGSVEEGRKWKAFASAHETGLAIDLSSHGLEANSKTVEAQRNTELFGWLRENAYKFGWAPYKREPWHWEFPVEPNKWARERP